MSNQASLGTGDDDAQGAQSSTSTESSPLQNATPRLDDGVQLSAIEEELKQCKEENEALKIRLKYTETDPLENEDVKSIIARYVCQIEDLKKKNIALCQGSDARMVEEHLMLQKRNKFLIQANAELAQKTANLAGEVHQYKMKNDVLQEDLAALRISSSEVVQQTMLGSAKGTPVGDDEEDLTAARSAPSSANNDKNEQLRHWAKQLLVLVKEYQVKDRELEQENKSLTSENEHLKEESKRLVAQMEVVVKERDVLLDEKKSFQRPNRVEAVAVSPGAASAPVQGSSTSSRPSSLYLEHYQNLVTQLQNEVKELKEELQHKDDHIEDQEEKIQKLMARIADAEEDRKALKYELESANSQSPTKKSQQIDHSRGDVDEIVRENQRKSKHIIELGKQNELLGEELESLKVEMRLVTGKNETLSRELEAKKGERPNDDVYEVQLKAFQDDWKAEHSEKQSIQEHADNLKLENQRLQEHVNNQQLEKQSLQEHVKNLKLKLEKMEQGQRQFPSPPHGYEHGAQSPPVMHHSVSDPLTSAAQMGNLPSSGGQMFQGSHPGNFMRSNTIPPPNQMNPYGAATHGLEYYSSHPNYPSEQVPRAPLGRNRMPSRPMEGGHGEPNTYPRNWPR